MNRILVLPQRLARQLDLDVPHAIISIRDPGDDFTLPVRWGQRGVLPLYFHDLEPGQDGVLYGIKLMTPEHADEAWQFIREHEDAIDTLVIHCWAGISRSAGMADAVAECMGGCRVDTEGRETHPNKHVYRMMKSAFTGNVAKPQPSPVTG